MLVLISLAEESRKFPAEGAAPLEGRASVELVVSGKDFIPGNV